jgi:membrane-associated PAP2 superfamily phosphatase
MEQLTTALFLATANYAIINYLADPVRQQYPNLNLWWLVYVAFATGAALSWLAGVDLLAVYIDNALVSRLVTALVIGGGSNLIHNIFGSTGPEDG